VRAPRALFESLFWAAAGHGGASRLPHSPQFGRWQRCSRSSMAFETSPQGSLLPGCVQPPQCRRNDDCRNDDNDRCRAKACSSPFVILIFCLMAQEELEDLICLAEVLKPSA
jgi:hypothetical protein